MARGHSRPALVPGPLVLVPLGLTEVEVPAAVQAPEQAGYVRVLAALGVAVGAAHIGSATKTLYRWRNKRPSPRWTREGLLLLLQHVLDEVAELVVQDANHAPHSRNPLSRDMVFSSLGLLQTIQTSR